MDLSVHLRRSLGSYLRDNNMPGISFLLNNLPQCWVLNVVRPSYDISLGVALSFISNRWRHCRDITTHSTIDVDATYALKIMKVFCRMWGRFLTILQRKWPLPFGKNYTVRILAIIILLFLDTSLNSLMIAFHYRFCMKLFVFIQNYRKVLLYSNFTHFDS